MIDAVYSRVFRWRSPIDRIMEEHILERLKTEAGMLDTSPSDIEFKDAIKENVRMKRAMIVAERTHEFNMSVSNLTKKNRWRPAVLKRFNRVPRYGRLVVEAALEGKF